MILQLLVNGVINGSVCAILAMGFALIYSTTRIFHFAHGAVYTFCGYMFYTFSYNRGWPFALALLFALGLTSILGIILESQIYYPLVKHRSPLLVQLLSSIGIYTVIVNLIALVYGSDAKSLSAELQPAYSIGPIVITRIQTITILTFVVLFCGMAATLRLTRLGKTVRAMRDDEELVSVMGMNPRTVRCMVFLVGSLFAGIAAILTGLDVGIDPHVGIAAFLNAAVAVIIGGVRSFKGAALGALLLGILQSLVVWQTSTRWQETITFLVLILFLLFRPGGMLAYRRRFEVTGA